MICKQVNWFVFHFVDNIFERAWVYFLHTDKRLQVFLSNTNNSLYYQSFFVHCEMASSIAM